MARSSQVQRIIDALTPEVEAELAAAKSNLTQATAESERYASLKARGWAAVAEYERKNWTKDEAEARLERARRAREIAGNQLAYAELRAEQVREVVMVLEKAFLAESA